MTVRAQARSRTTTQAPGYARPKCATPLNASALVPAFEECTSAERLARATARGAIPAARRSRASDYLTFGAPDVTGDPVHGGGAVDLKVVGESPIDPNNGDQADVADRREFH